MRLEAARYRTLVWTWERRGRAQEGPLVADLDLAAVTDLTATRLRHV